MTESTGCPKDSHNTCDSLLGAGQHEVGQHAQTEHLGRNSQDRENNRVKQPHGFYLLGDCVSGVLNMQMTN